MRSSFPVSFFAVVIIITAAACNRAPAKPHDYPVHGQVIAIAPDHKSVTLNHDDIKGFMPAMTMPYDVKDPAILNGLAPGDVVDARLQVVGEVYLTEMKKVGSAPLPKQPEPSPSASSGFELLKPGEKVPDGTFLDQDGRKRKFDSFQGETVVMTFIYTRCPMPTFCPLMDRHFVAIQKHLESDAALRGKVHLVTVSFDPLTDTPPVLKKHAKELGANLKTWTFLTGDRDDIDKFASRFGVSVARSLTDQRDITHNLRTAIISPSGALVKVYTGNEWTPDQILADLQPIVRAN